MHHRLGQIADDGSQKLPVRVLPALRQERAAGRLPPAATRILAAWVGHLRGAGVPVRDARADELVPLAEGPLPEAVPWVLAALDPAAGGDDDVVKAVVAQAQQFERGERP
jgi:fructuronate reductase